MSTNYGIIVLKDGRSGMVHLMKPVTFKGGNIYYSIGWADSKVREDMTGDKVESFTYCSK